MTRDCTTASRAGTAGRLVAAGLGTAVGGYLAWAAASWLRYGRPRRTGGEAADAMLDRFMPDYEVVERHRIAVAAPASITMDAAREQDLISAPIVRAIFDTRARLMGARPAPPAHEGLLSEVLSLGWGILEETPGEVVLGAVTRPWEADVTFTALPPDTFAAFSSPGYVKIIWSLRADEVGPDRSIFRTETRAVATDPAARARFRRYWALASPGIALIRLLSLRPLKADAERRWHEAMRPEPQPV